MRIMKVEFEISVPDVVTIEQVEEWLLFELGARGGMQSDNPMIGVRNKPIFHLQIYLKRL